MKAIIERRHRERHKARRNPLRHVPKVQAQLWGAQEAVRRITTWGRGGLEVSGHLPGEREFCFRGLRWRLRLMWALWRRDSRLALDLLELTSPMLGAQQLTSPPKA